MVTRPVGARRWRVLGVALIGLLAPIADAAPARFWLSSSPIDPLGPSAPTESAVVGTTRYLNLWAQPATVGPGPHDADTNPFRVLSNLSLNVVTFDPRIDYGEGGAYLHNPKGDAAAPRFQFTSAATTFFATPPTAFPTESVTLAGFSISNSFPVNGIGPACGADPLCSLTPSGEPAWLLGAVPYTVTSAGGPAEAYLQIGPVGINHAGESSSLTEASFGSIPAGQPVYNAGSPAERNETIGSDLADFTIPAVASPAQSLSWNTGSGDWAVAGNLNPASTPTSVDNATLPGSLLAGDVITVTGSQAANTVAVDRGRLRLAGNGSLAGNVNIGAGGAVSGTGWVSGDVDFSAGGTLAIEAGDPLRVVGEADVSGGVLGLTGDLFLPTNQVVEVTVLEAGAGIVGTLATTASDTIANGVTVQTITHNNNSVVVELLSTLSPTVFGDYNADGVIDASDYTVWRDSLGQTGAGLPADGDGSETVDAADYSIWVANFGKVAVASTVAAAAVPEPLASTAALAALGAVIAPRRRAPTAN